MDKLKTCPNCGLECQEIIECDYCGKSICEKCNYVNWTYVFDEVVCEECFEKHT